MGTIQQVRHQESVTGADSHYSNSISETAVPYAEFKKAGFEIDFVTEKGNMPECDSKMLEGMTQKLLVGYVMTFGPDLCSHVLSLSTGCQ